MSGHVVQKCEGVRHYHHFPRVVIISTENLAKSVHKLLKPRQLGKKLGSQSTSSPHAFPPQQLTAGL